MCVWRVLHRDDNQPFIISIHAYVFNAAAAAAAFRAV